MLLLSVGGLAAQTPDKADIAAIEKIREQGLKQSKVMDLLFQMTDVRNGTGKVRGIWMQSNPNVAPIFSAWIAPLKDLGVEILGPRSVASTDHTNIDRTGVPWFQFVQERLEYNSRTHHSTMDFYDRVRAEDLKQTATVAAVFAYHTAMRDQKLPRK